MDPLLARLQRALAGRYTVEHELGRGGMAVVYLGRDLRLERRVAIKVFEKEGGLISAGERFLREIRIAAQLQHPNILPVHDSGEGEGLVYYVMPYVAGGSVRERLEREGPLPVPDAVRIAREVAEALDHAHRAGVVHRDIKPDDITLADGGGVVADFGIARAIEQAGGKVTDTGLAIGTPTYMSPEQAGASPQIDGRTDIYALGCVLYEMLAGTPAFSGTTAQQVMARHATDTAPPLGTVRQVPPALEATVSRALAKLPADRWPTGRALAEALGASGETPVGTGASPAAKSRWRWGVLGAAGIALLGAGFALFRGRRSDAGATGPVRTLAVLPFTSSGDTAWANFADGLSEGVGTGLVRVGGLGVVGGSRVQGYRDRIADPRDIGRELGVSTVLSGGVRFGGNKFRVTTQLIEVASGRTLWQQQFSGELLVNGRMGDVFAVMDSMTGMIVDALQLQLAPAHRASLARGVGTRDPEAYRLYLAAHQANYVVTLENLEHSIQLLEQALRRDSTFADAWVELALTWETKGSVFGVERAPEVALRWRRAVEHAIELDSTNGFSFGLRGSLRLYYEWEWDGARRDHLRGVRLAPGSADAAYEYAFFLSFANESDSALAYARRAVSLDPNNSLLWGGLGRIFAFSGMLDSALAASRRALELDSLQWTADYARVNALLAMGRRPEAESAAAHWRRLSAGKQGARAFLADYYRRTGNPAGARAILEELLDLSRKQYVSPAKIGAARLALGDRAGALDALEESLRNRDLDLIPEIVLLYSSLAGDPRFEAVRHRVFGSRPVPRNPFP